MSLVVGAAIVARRLAATPTYTLGVVITLALALGTNAAVFGVVHSTVLNPIAARDPGRLMVVWKRPSQERCRCGARVQHLSRLGNAQPHLFPRRRVWIVDVDRDPARRR